MKTSSNLFASTIVVAIAAFASSTVFAQEIMPASEINSFVSQKTRAEVRAELQQAFAERRIARNEEDYQRLGMADFVSAKTRAQVAAETREAARLGLIARNYHDYPLPTPTAEQLRMVELAGERTLGNQLASR